LELKELLGNEELAREDGLVALQRLDAPVLGILERLATRLSRREPGLAFTLELRTPGR